MGYKRSGIDWSEVFSLRTVLYLLPLILTAVYVWICFTPLINNMYMKEKPNILIDGVIENGWYDMFFKRLVENWFAEPVPLDLWWLGKMAIKACCWLLALGVDLFVTIVLFVLGGILELIYLVLEYVYILIIPAGVAGLSIFNLIHGIYEEDEAILKVFSGLVCVASVLGILFYYVMLFQYHAF